MNAFDIGRGGRETLEGEASGRGCRGGGASSEIVGGERGGEGVVLGVSECTGLRRSISARLVLDGDVKRGSPSPSPPTPLLWRLRSTCRDAVESKDTREGSEGARNGGGAGVVVVVEEESEEEAKVGYPSEDTPSSRPARGGPPEMGTLFIL